ncbi:hypothetical protein BBJ29_008090 [Phytophthora kernoviae]|uniref:Zinc finger C2HC5-type domain-containing protein n=1 Tax=Phytophthora kernoviae TaxID=325452 RepID=A0A3F2RKS2_9STRA|nr:hypothetical protein BBP00_00006563 [Phytophthora kernoviae]RLN66293.1 hypothetical protein BBJ29_008090 [Phytophthora kernoviae]
MVDAETTAWLKKELVSALGFGEVDEIVAYITSTFHTKQETSSYLIELLGIPETRAESIGTRLFSPPSVGATAQQQEGLVPRPAAVNSRLKPSQKGKKGKTAALLNNALIINCLRCGKIEYNGARRCGFCETELQYEADEVTADPTAQQHMEELVRLDETGAERTQVLDTEQFFYDEQEQQEGNSRRPISLALDLDNRRFVESGDIKIVRNNQLAKDARDLVVGVQRKMNKSKRGKGSGQETPPVNGGIREALVVVDDSVKGLTALQRGAATTSNQCEAPTNPLWDFYASGLVDENDNGSGGEDTEDELETQDWILFQRQRAQARLANACQREARTMRAAKN